MDLLNNIGTEQKKIVLRPISRIDGMKIIKWRNEIETKDEMFSSGCKDLIWFYNYLDDPNRTEFIIITKTDNKKIGTIGLSNIDNVNRKAEYGVMIGEKKERRKGYAFEASNLIINYAFCYLDLKKIYLKVFAKNNKAIAMYKKLKFTKEGTLRGEILKNGKYEDVVIMSLLREEI